jgi:hypothetical protein
VPLQDAPKASQRAFRLWWQTLPNHKAISEANFHLLEIDSKEIESGLPAGKGGKRIKRVVTPQQLAQKLLAQVKIGEAGEAIALEFERKRLKALKVANPNACIRHVAEENIAAGYDIESKSLEEGTRYIEVKSTVATAGDGFYISAGELAALRDLGREAYIYFVEVDRLPRGGQVVAVVCNPVPILDNAGVLEYLPPAPCPLRVVAAYA